MARHRSVRRAERRGVLEVEIGVGAAAVRGQPDSMYRGHARAPPAGAVSGGSGSIPAGRRPRHAEHVPMLSSVVIDRGRVRCSESPISGHLQAQRAAAAWYGIEALAPLGRPG